MDATLSTLSSKLAPNDLHEITLDLCKTLNLETDARARLEEQAGGAGTRGDLITVGTIALSFLSSGAAVALLNVLKSYFERNSSLEMEFQRKDGKKLMIRTENVRSNEIDKTIELARGFFGGSP